MRRFSAPQELEADAAACPLWRTPPQVCGAPAPVIAALQAAYPQALRCYPWPPPRPGMAYHEPAGPGFATLNWRALCPCPMLPLLTPCFCFCTRQGVGANRNPASPRRACDTHAQTDCYFCPRPFREATGYGMLPLHVGLVQSAPSAVVKARSRNCALPNSAQAPPSSPKAFRNVPPVRLACFTALPAAARSVLWCGCLGHACLAANGGAHAASACRRLCWKASLRLHRTPTATEACRCTGPQPRAPLPMWSSRWWRRTPQAHPARLTHPPHAEPLSCVYRVSPLLPPRGLHQSQAPLLFLACTPQRQPARPCARTKHEAGQARGHRRSDRPTSGLRLSASLPPLPAAPCGSRLLSVHGRRKARPCLVSLWRVMTLAAGPCLAGALTRDATMRMPLHLAAARQAAPEVAAALVAAFPEAARLRDDAGDLPMHLAAAKQAKRAPWCPARSPCDLEHSTSAAAEKRSGRPSPVAARVLLFCLMDAPLAPAALATRPCEWHHSLTISRCSARFTLNCCAHLPAYRL